jgi:tetratricopeptide (TPR) repeat protein
MAVEWREVIGWGQDEVDELRAIAYAYMRQGQLKLAQTFFEALVILEPNSLYDLRTLAGLRDLLGDPQGSVTLYQEALTRDPRDPFSQLGLAKAQLAAGQATDALPRLQQLATSPDKRIATDAQALLLAYR